MARSAPHFAAAFLAIKIGVVHLHLTTIGLASLALIHHLHQFVRHIPAVGWFTPRRRPNSRLEMPVLLWVR